MNNLYIKGLVCLTAGSTSGSDPISKFFTIITELISPISNQITAIAVIVVLISGLLFMLPLPKRFKEKAGGYLIFLIIGGLLVSGAAQWANYFNARVRF